MALHDAHAGAQGGVVQAGRHQADAAAGAAHELARGRTSSRPGSRARGCARRRSPLNENTWPGPPRRRPRRGRTAGCWSARWGRSAGGCRTGRAGRCRTRHPSRSVAGWGHPRVPAAGRPGRPSAPVDTLLQAVASPIRGRRGRLRAAGVDAGGSRSAAAGADSRDEFISEPAGPHPPGAATGPPAAAGGRWLNGRQRCTSCKSSPELLYHRRRRSRWILTPMPKLTTFVVEHHPQRPRKKNAGLLPIFTRSSPAGCVRAVAGGCAYGFCHTMVDPLKICTSGVLVSVRLVTPFP